MTQPLTLDALDRRIQKLEKAVFGKGPASEKQKSAVKESDDNKAGLPNLILKLRDQGFFKTAKTANEVHQKLQITYACSVDRVAMALLRLQRRKLLRKTTKVVGQNEQVAYAW